MSKALTTTKRSSSSRRGGGGWRRSVEPFVSYGGAALTCILLLCYLFTYYPARMGLLTLGIFFLLAGILGIRIAFWWYAPQRRLARLTLDTRYIPDSLRLTVLARDRYQCVACHSPSYLHIDHIVPLSRGGATSLENLQVLCRTCNQRKGNR